MERQRAGSSADPSARLPPPKTRSPTTLKTVTLDGSLLGAHLAGGGSPQRAGVGPAGRRLSNPLRSPVPLQPPPPQIYLDKGETEDTYLHTLRTHFVRNGTAEAVIPLGRPSRKYSAFSPSAAAAGAATPPGSSGSRAVAPAGSGPGGLQRQELELWQEREEELLDAQDLRLGQLESALRSREEKREAYVVHRLEAAAADKVQQLAAQRRGLGRQQQLLARHARHAGLGGQAPTSSRPAPPAVVLPALPKSAIKPLLPASPVLAYAVKEAREGLSSYQHVSNLEAGLLSKQAFGTQHGAPQHSAPQSPTALGHFLDRSAWAQPQDRKEAAHSRQLDLVYANMQMLKSTGTQRATHPLEPLHTKRGTTSSGTLSSQQTGKGQGDQQGLASQPAVAGTVEQGYLQPGQEELGEESNRLQSAQKALGHGDAGPQGQQGASKEEVSGEDEEEAAIEEVMLLHRRAAASSPRPEPAAETAASQGKQAAPEPAGDKPQLASSSLSMGQLQEEEIKQPFTKREQSAECEGGSAPTASSQFETEATGAVELRMVVDASSSDRTEDMDVQAAGAAAVASELDSGEALPDAVMSAEQLEMQLQQTVEEQLFHLASAELEDAGEQGEPQRGAVPAQQGAIAEVAAAADEHGDSLLPLSATASEVAAAGAPPLAAGSDGEAAVPLSRAKGTEAEEAPVSVTAVEELAAAIALGAASDEAEPEVPLVEAEPEVPLVEAVPAEPVPSSSDDTPPAQAVEAARGELVLVGGDSNLPESAGAAEAAAADLDQAGTDLTVVGEMQASEAPTGSPRGSSSEVAGTRLSTADALVSEEGKAVVPDEGVAVAAAVVAEKDGSAASALGLEDDGSAAALVSEQELSATLEAVAEEELQGYLQGSAWAELPNTEPVAPHSAA